MLGSVGSFELLVFLLGGFLLFRLWQRAGETEREQHRLNLRATELERRLAQTEKELEAVRRSTGGEATMPVPIATPAVAPKAEQVVATLAKLTAANAAAPPPISVVNSRGPAAQAIASSSRRSMFSSEMNSGSTTNGTQA